ncbi:MAG: PilZ domain-containing protein [Myxococcales bacterium]|nr:PilZ domain-containing protein [Myxococcales bacterium]
MRVVLRLDSPSEWIKVFDPRDGTLAVEVSPRAVLGDTLRIDLLCGEGGPRVILRGQVIGHRGDEVALVGLGPAEREKVNYMNGFVRGGLLNLRENRRIPVRLAVTYGGLKGPVKTHTRDINDRGVFVTTDEPLPEDAEVHLIITIPGQAEPLSVVGRVTHTVVPEDEDVAGMGIVFRSSAADAELITTTIDALEQAFLAGTLPEDTLA